MTTIDEKNKRALYELIRSGEVLLFAGSGMSIDAGYATVDALIDRIRARVPPELRGQLDQRSLSDVAEKFLHIRGREQGRAELVELIREEFCRAPDHTRHHDRLSEIPQIRTIITTNYDPLFELAYRDALQVIIDRHDLAAYDKEKVRLYKIHGSPEKPDSLIISRSDCRESLTQDLRGDVYWSEIRALCTKHAVVFIGYSLSDFNIENVFADLQIQLEGHQKPMFLVSPHWPEYEVRHLEETLNIRYIDQTAEEFVGELKRSVDAGLLEDHRDGHIDNVQFQQAVKRGGRRSAISTDDDGNTQVKIWPDSTKGIKGTPIDFRFIHEDKTVEDAFRALAEGRCTEPLQISSESGLKSFYLYIGGVGRFPYREGDRVKFEFWPEPDLTAEVVIVSKSADDAESRFFDTATLSVYDSPESTTVRIENPMIRIVAVESKTDHPRGLTVTANRSNNLLTALRNYRFFSDWIEGETIEVLTGDTGLLLFRLHPPDPATIEKDDGLRTIMAGQALMKGLKTVCDALELPYPSLDRLSDVDPLVIREFLNYIEGRRILSPITFTFTLQPDGSEDDQFRDFLENGASTFGTRVDVHGILCGDDIEFSCEIVVEEAHVVNQEEIQRLFEAGEREFLITIRSDTGCIRPRLVREGRDGASAGTE